jgi:hypothetical protein
MDSIQKEMARVSQSMAKMAVAAPAPGAMSSFTNSGAMTVGSGSANQNTLNIYPIVPWDPEHTDFASLREDKLLRAHEQAFVSNSPVETLMFLHMSLKPPRHHFVYMPSTDPEDARFFDGTSYKRAADPRGEFRKGYDVYHRELVSFMTEREEELRRGCYFADTDFDVKKASLLESADKANCADAIAKRLSRHANAVQSQAIAPHKILVE